MSKSGILTKSNSEIIKNDNAILLSNNDVINLRNLKIHNYPNAKEIWALKYGLVGLGISNMLTNTSINLFYRKNFLLKYANSSAGLFSSLLITAIFPTATSASILSIYFTNGMLSSNQSECMICKEIKSVGLHLLIGSLIPTFMAWTTNYFQASIYKTYGIPETDWLFKDSKSRKQFFYYFKKVFKNTTKNSSNHLIKNYSIQILLCTLVLYYQQKQFKQYIEPLEFSLSEIKKFKP